MSLNVMLISDVPVRVAPSDGIFIREDGATKEISRAEWDRRFPGREPVSVRPPEEETFEVYSANITHNLNRMAVAANLYATLWHPEDRGATHAVHLIAPLAKGLTELHTAPEQFKRLNPENGWGNYEELVKFVENYLIACIQNPNAKIRVSR